MDKNVLLYYFSGTGNSRRLAFIAASRFEEAGFRAVVGNIEDNRLAHEHSRYNCHGFVFPSLGFGIPRNMTRFMKALPPAGGKEAFIIVSMGNEEFRLPPSEGKCISQGKRILQTKGYKVIGAEAVSMPNNWISAFSAPPPEKAAGIVEAGEKAVRAFTDKLIAGEIYFKKSHWLSKLLGVTINPLMLWGLNYLPWLFWADKKCNSCEVCAKTCPEGNIEIVDGKPKWGKSCVWCHRCINLCPRESSQTFFFGPTTNRRRYKESHLKLKDLVKGTEKFTTRES